MVFSPRDTRIFSNRRRPNTMNTAESNTQKLTLFSAQYLCPYADHGGDDVAYIGFMKKTKLMVGTPEMKDKKQLDKPKEVTINKTSLSGNDKFTSIKTYQPIVRMEIVDMTKTEEDLQKNNSKHHLMEIVEPGTYDVTYAIPEVPKVDEYDTLIINMTYKTERVEVAKADIAVKAFPSKDAVEILLDDEEISGHSYTYSDMYGVREIGDYEGIKCECPLIGWKKVETPKTVVKKRRVLKIVA